MLRRLMIAVVVLCCTADASQAVVTYEMVTVGDAGNVADAATGYGAVPYEYQIGKYDVTIGQYAAFLNAVAATDTYGLYNTSMQTDLTVAGISRSGSSGSYTYNVIAASGSAPYGGVSNANRPITYVSWFDSARFANWMSNGQPTGGQTSATTEDGAYSLSGTYNAGIAPSKNVTNPNTGTSPTFFIPNENEWYKAAYYKGGSTNAGYWPFATQADNPPSNYIGAASNQANYINGIYPDIYFAVTRSLVSDYPQNLLTDVGAFSGSGSKYGTYDQSGNVNQWNDLDGAAGSFRGMRGGCWQSDDTAFALSSSASSSIDPASESGTAGFRLAAPAAIPEPSTITSLTIGLGVGVWHLSRRKRA